MKKANRFTRFSKFLILIVTIGLALPCGMVMAQDDEFTLEEIVVTAEFREKQLQDTPLSITAISADMLEARNQVSLDQIAMQAPNVTLKPNNASMGSSLVAFIRGVGQTDFNPSVEPGVGIYVDDVYYATITGNILDLLDLERVEVLRGPQGTLAGRNAIGGAIKLISKKPEGRGEGYFSTTFGKFDRLDIRGAGDFAITDKFFVRLSGTSRSRDGYVTRMDYACVTGSPAPGSNLGLPSYTTLGSNCELAKEGGQSMTAGRIALRWIPNDNFEVNFTTNIVNDKSESQPTVLIDAVDNSGTSVPVISDPVTGVAPSPAYNPNSVSLVPIFFDNNGNGTYEAGIDVPYDSRFVTGGSYINYATYIDNGQSTPSPYYVGGNPGQDISVYKPSALPPINHFESRDYTLNLDIRLSDNVSLKSISSYREYTNTFADDNDGSPLALQQLLQRMVHEQWTQEFRLNATLFDGFADTTLGVFYLDKETNEDARVDINYSGLDFYHGPDIVPSKSKAVYGQASLHLNERMDLTLGLRYSKDEKSYTFHRHNPDGSPVALYPVTNVGFFEAGNVANAGVFGLDGSSLSYESDRFDYRAAIDYDINDDIMVYFQIASGYKAGGNNARPFFPTQLHATQPEELINYEAGFKSVLADQLRLNGSVFFNDYTDLQLLVSECSWAPEGQQTPCASVANVGDAEVSGLELEAAWHPTKYFSVDMSYSYLDFEYTKIDTTTGVAIDSSAPFTPENQFSIGAQYRFDLGKWGDLTERVDYSWQDDQFTAALNSTSAFVPAYGIFNGRVTWRSEDLKWQASLECSNITDEYYYLTIYDLMTGAGYVNGQPARPQEWAFTVKRVWYFD